MRKHLSHSNAFLLEILLDLIIFAVLLTISLELFMHAHTATRRTSDLYQVVEYCETFSDLFENDDDAFSLTKQCYPAILSNEKGYQMYLDKNFVPVNEKELATYTIYALIEKTDDSQVDYLNISCCDEKNRELYTLRASRYHQKEIAYLLSFHRKEVAV